jgi:hypothetical protein
LIGQELYLPPSWANNPARCRAAHIPEETGFQTSPVAQVMLERTLAGGWGVGFMGDRL